MKLAEARERIFDLEMHLKMSRDCTEELRAENEQLQSSLTLSREEGRREGMVRAAEIAADQNFDHVDCDGCRTARDIAAAIRSEAKAERGPLQSEVGRLKGVVAAMEEGCYVCQHPKRVDELTCQKNALQQVVREREEQIIQMKNINSSLVAIATGEIRHIYDGICPDTTVGYDVRDPNCPACRILLDSAA